MGELMRSILTCSETLMVFYCCCCLGSSACIVLLSTDLLPRRLCRLVDGLSDALFIGALLAFCVVAWNLFWMGSEVAR